MISTVGMPLSTQVTVVPSSVSRTLPVGSSFPAPGGNSITTGAAVPGTPEISASPVYSTRPPGVGKVAVARSPELTMRIRTEVSSSPAGTSPRSTANGPTPARMFPQF